MNTYILITAEQEPNIGVLEFTDKNISLIILTEKLKKCLEEHFDAKVEVKDIDIRGVNPHTAFAHVVIDEDEQAYPETIFLNQTWIY